MKRMMMLVSIAVFCSVIILINMSILFFGLALLPSVMAYFVDTSLKKLAFKVVLSGNISAALPTLMPIIKSSMHMRKFDISHEMIDPRIWLFIDMGAAAGWALIYLCKFIARFAVAMSFEYNIRTLENAQKLLRDEWGSDVAQFKDKPRDSEY